MAQATLDFSTSAEAQPRTRAPRPWKWLAAPLWIALAVAALVGLYAAAGFWLAPRIIRSQVVSQVAERYHRTASLGEVKVNPFALRMQADRFSLPDADGKPMIGFDRLTVKLSIASLWRGGPAFREIVLDAPKIRLVRRANGRLNIQDLVPPKREPQRKMKVTIDHLAVNRGRGEFHDLAREKPFTKTFAPVDFTLRDFSTVKQGASYVLKARTERDEGLAWRGTFGLDPLVSSGAFALTRVKAPPLAELAGEAVPFRVTSGQVDVTGGYSFALRGKALTLRGNVRELRLTDTGLRAEGADADWVILPLVTVSNVRADVPARSIAVERIEATGPQVTAWTVGTGVNLARYGGRRGTAPASAPAPAPTAAQAGSPWTVELPDLRVRGAKVTFEERSLATPVRFTAAPLDLTVTGFALPVARPIHVDASAVLNRGGRLAAKGPVTLGQKLTADLEVAASQIGLPWFQPYIDRSADLRLLSGRAAANGHLSYAAKGATGSVIRFDGRARVDGLHTVDKVLNQDFINWRVLELEGVSVRADPLFVKIREVVAQEPYARVVIGPNYVMNIATVLNPKAAAAQPVVAPPPPQPRKAGFTFFSNARKPPPSPPKPAAPPRKALPVEIALVTVRKGQMDFADLSINPNFIAGIKQLDGAVKGLSGRQDARAAVNMKGQVDEYSPVTISGQVNYFAARSYTDIAMTFRNVEMTTLSPYSGRFGGYKINRGKLNVDLNYNIDDQKLNANHRVVINQLQLGEKVESDRAVKLPVKLVVALLKDRHGVIDVPIKIRGTLDDPKFKVWPVIWQVVRNLMSKIATAPFAALGAVLGGGGGDDLQYIDFAPGSATLDAASQQKVASVAKALAERPSVNLEAPMVVNPELDRPALVEAKLDAKLAAAAAKKGKSGGVVPTDPKRRRDLLEEVYRQEFGAKPEIPKAQAAEGEPKPDSDAAAVAWLEGKLKARLAVTDDDLKGLGQDRARAVQAALLSGGQLEPSRVFITAQQAADEKDAKAARPDSVRMALSLS